MKNLKSGIISLTVFIFTLITVQNVSAQSVRDRTTSTTESAAAPVVKNEGYRKAANDAGGAQQGGTQQGTMIGGVLAATSASLFAGTPECGCEAAAVATAAASALSFMAAGHNSGKAGDSKNLADQFTVSSDSGSSTTEVPKSTESLVASNSAAKKNAAEMKAKGYTIDYSKKTMTGPDGKTQNLADLVSADAVSKMNAENQAMFKKALNDASKKASAGSADSFGGGVAVNGGGGGSSGETGSGDGVGGPAAGGINRDPAQVQGLTTMYNGEPIGVKSDSIFGIVDRRYDLHAKQGSFIGAGGN